MTRYARRLEGQGLLRAGISRAGVALVNNPAAVGGTTAFLVALSFVSANAVWYQQQVHPSAFVSTRMPASPSIPKPDVAPEPPPRPSPAPREESSEASSGSAAADPAPTSETTGSVAAQGGDPVIRSVQKVLSDLGLYRGSVDGLSGPQTQDAIENYRRIVGLKPGDNIDEALLEQLGLNSSAEVTQAPVPVPRPALQEDGEEIAKLISARTQNSSDSAGTVGNEAVKRVQAGLMAFGHEGISVDGMLGENTRAAIRDFQSLFGLSVTGEADAELLAKMQEIGLIN